MAELEPTSLKESETVEFKEQFSDSALKTLAAFVNTKGGSLYVGVKNDATLISEGITDKVQQDVVSKTINVLGVTPEVILHHHKGNDFLEGESWDAITDERFKLDDIDHDEVRNFVQSAQRESRIPPDFEKENVETILERLGLLIQEELTNASIILFGKDPQRYFPNAVVRIRRFRDEATIVADRTVSGHLFHQAQGAEEQIKSLISRRYDISDESFKRRDVWQYPLAAIREALLNALVHRNYFEMNVKIQIKVFDDMLWIYNPGKLPGTLEVEDLKRPHSSHPRNRLIANTFYRAGLIEEWGSGIQRMTAALQEEGLPEPNFEEQGDGFVAKLYGQEWTGIKAEVYESLNDRQKAAIDYIRKHGSIDNSTYQELTDVSKRTATRDLKELTEKDIVKKQGKGAGTRYTFIE